MCGICGIVGRERVERDVLTRMTRALRHRGPDDEGLHIEECADGFSVGLGFRRLAIIDLESGNQPLANEDDSLQLVFNGEIYNYRELRARLERRGHRFKTNSDTEVVVHLYEDAGLRCLEQLNGMFALALWDRSKRELILARDRFGKKPLYYARVGKSLLFGSELKALREHPGCPSEIDLGALSRYLALEYVPAPWSILGGVRKLPGGHILRFRDGRASVERWWTLSFAPDRSRRDDESYVEEFRELLSASVRRRLVSDVPLGAFLSGGIDSSSIVAMMADAMPASAVKTFTIGFEAQSFDESSNGRRVAKHFGTEHHDEVFTPRALIDLLPIAADALDEPFGDASFLPTYVLSRFTRDFVTVALGGDGSDELLAGYPTFPADRIARLYRPPRVLHDHVVVSLADHIPVSTDNFSFDFKLKRFLRGAHAPTAARHATWLGSFTPAEQAELLGRPAADVFGEQNRVLVAAPASTPLNRLIYLYAMTYLQDDILFKVDRASMASSLEVRAPFLDIELVEFIGRLPERLKMRRLRTKHVLKQAMSDRLPQGIADRPKKGFGIPIAEWFKKELRAQLQDELSEDRIKRQGLFDASTVTRLVSEHLSGRRDHRKQLWTLFAFQLWHRRWMDEPGLSRNVTAAPLGSRQ